MEYFSNINWLPVLVALIVNQALGFLWYSPSFFGNSWAAEMKLDMSQVDKGSAMKGVMISTVMSFIINIAMALLIGYTDSWTLAGGAGIGLLVAIGFVAPSIATNAGYEGKSFKLYMITAGYQILCLAISGAIIGAWH